jgi:hypothetical protein
VENLIAALPQTAFAAAVPAARMRAADPGGRHGSVLNRRGRTMPTGASGQRRELRCRARTLYRVPRPVAARPQTLGPSCDDMERRTMQLAPRAQRTRL